MMIFGAIVLAGVALYFIGFAIETQGLSSQDVEATVTDKEYREAGTTYRAQRIGNRTQTVPVTTGEMYILKLDVDGAQTECVVDKELYTALSSGSRVTVTCQRRRITGKIQVSGVRRTR